MRIEQTYEFKAVYQLSEAFRALPPENSAEFADRLDTYEAALWKLVHAMRANGREI